VHLAIGVNERESDRPGTMYNSLLMIGPGGLLHRHRKLMPTHSAFHGIGAGDDRGPDELSRGGTVIVEAGSGEIVAGRSAAARHADPRLRFARRVNGDGAVTPDPGPQPAP
jgi:hypothetical protein